MQLKHTHTQRHRIRKKLKVLAMEPRVLAGAGLKRLARRCCTKDREAEWESQTKK